MAKPKKTVPTDKKRLNLKPQVSVDWVEIELLYVTSPIAISLRDLSDRLNLSPQTVMSQAHRGKWNAKRAAAKGKNPVSPVLLGKLGQSGTVGNGESGELSTNPIDNQSKSASTEEKPRAGFLALGEEKQSLSQVRASRAETYDKKMAALAERLPEAMAQMSDKELLAHSGDIVKLDGVNRKALGLDIEQNARAPLVQINLLNGAHPVPRPTFDTVNTSIPAT